MRLFVMYRLMPALRHVGHLDLMRAMQRALRRSGLPVKFSQGFNPHIILSLAAPLSVGMAGDMEVMDLPLAQPVLMAEFLSAFGRALPPGIRLVGAKEVDEDADSAMGQVYACTVRFDFLEDADALLAAVPQFLALQTYPMMRRSKKGMKSFDLRPLVYNLSVREGKLFAVLALSPEGTAKAEQVLEALMQLSGAARPALILTRTGLLNARFVPLEQGYVAAAD